MNPEQWQQAREVLADALELKPEDRPGFLDRACSSDDSLRQEVERLLSSSDEARSSFLQSSTFHVTLTPGTKLGDYEVERLLASGGMGEVYRAHDRRLGRDVAIKVLPSFLSHDPDRLRRFEQEARTAAALSHPNILAVFQMGTYEGAPYLVSELLEGGTLREQLVRGSLPPRKAIDYGVQIARGLAAAHEKGIVHRDLKPENLFVTKEGRVKVLDFGLAKLTQAPKHSETAPTVSRGTEPGLVMGTIGYMSPEQARGEEVDARTDLFSLGAVLYEMATGKMAFAGATVATIHDAILNRSPALPTQLNPDLPAEMDRIVAKALRKDRGARYQTASELLADLRQLQWDLESGRKAIRARVVAALMRPRIAVLALLVAVVLATSAIWFYRRNAHVRWAKEQVLPQIALLAEKGKYPAAFRLARQVDRYMPTDRALARLWDDISKEVSIQTDPPGAHVEMKDYSVPNDPWMYIGKTPMEKVRIPFGFFRWRISKPGFGTVYGAYPAWDDTLSFKLDPEETVPAGMVSVQGGTVSLFINTLGQLGPFKIRRYFIDRYEVTNKQFKEFIDSGGYEKRDYWKQKFIRDGHVLSWEEAVGQFRDATGRPGPSTWEGGRYPQGQDDFPVAGVSWYEAAAYAEFAGKSLPTIAHWYKAAEPWAGPYILPLSNFGSGGPARVGTYQGIGPYGAYDMAGNVKEWCWNETGKNLRFILGGSWGEPTYMFFDADARSPFDRSHTNGFRCVRYTDTVAEEVTAPQQRLSRDYTREKPVPDDVFRIYKGMYAYDRTELNAKIESVDNSSEYWRKEKVSFDPPVGGERVPAYLFLPKNVAPPYQAVVYFPGSDVLQLASSQRLEGMQVWDYIVKSGRAVLYPIYQGTYERRLSQLGAFTNIQWRDLVVQWSKELRRSLDYLDSRSDIDRTKFAYLGLSLGAGIGPVLAAPEERLKVCIFLDGGFYLGHNLPEIEEINFAPRLKTPALMINGRYDFTFPVETSQLPMFRLLGAPAEDKRHAVLETGHGVMVMRNEVIREVLNWLDRYLGKVK